VVVGVGAMVATFRRFQIYVSLGIQKVERRPMETQLHAMRKLIALLIAVAGLTTISAQGQGYCTGLTVVENFNETSWQTIACDQESIIVPGSVLSVDNSNISTVPEPSTLAFFAIGLAGVTLARRSFRQRPS